MTIALRTVLLAVLAIAAPVLAHAQTAEQYRTAAGQLPALIAERYAYLDRLPGGVLVVPPTLARQADSVGSRGALIRHAERVLLLLADHHAITGASRVDSWAVVPSYADLWIVLRGGRYLVDQVRGDSPAAAAGIRVGDTLVAVDGVPTSTAVAAFWSDLGTTGDAQRDAFAARVLAAGRRDRNRVLTIADRSGDERTLTLPNLYATSRADRPPVTLTRTGRVHRIAINNALGDTATIASFDAAMARIPAREPVVIDLTDTPAGGNTVVARAIMGWFARRPTGYQRHRAPAEERATGIARQWVELVLPRAGKLHRGPVTVRVGRWTGSMGEGLAIGLAELGARVEGSRMAGLLGAIEDVTLPGTDVRIKLPTERLSTVGGLPREDFAPAPVRK